MSQFSTEYATKKYMCSHSKIMVSRGIIKYLTHVASRHVDLCILVLSGGQVDSGSSSVYRHS